MRLAWANTVHRRPTLHDREITTVRLVQARDDDAVGTHAFPSRRPVLVEGAWDVDCIVEYRRDDELMGVVGVNRTADVTRYRKEIGRQ